MADRFRLEPVRITPEMTRLRLALKRGCVDLETLLQSFGTCREVSLALQKLEEVELWGQKALTRPGERR